MMNALKIGDDVVVYPGDGRELEAKIIGFHWMKQKHEVKFKDLNLIPGTEYYNENQLILASDERKTSRINFSKSIVCECGVNKAMGKEMPQNAHYKYCSKSGAAVLIKR